MSRERNACHHSSGSGLGGGNTVVGEAGAGVGEGITDIVVATAAATVVNGTGASIVVAGAGVAIITITTEEIVVAASLTLVTTPLLLLPTINCVKGRNAECPMQTMQVPMQVTRTWQWGHYCK
jgi:hypothetical protein